MPHPAVWRLLCGMVRQGGPRSYHTYEEGGNVRFAMLGVKEIAVRDRPALELGMTATSGARITLH